MKSEYTVKDYTAEGTPCRNVGSAGAELGCRTGRCFSLWVAGAALSLFLVPVFRSRKIIETRVQVRREYQRLSCQEY